MPEKQLKVGLLINPIAGMGGAVGLKGTDGERAARARELGASPQAGLRAARALSELRCLPTPVRWLTAKGPMGEDVLREQDMLPEIVFGSPGRDSSAVDTQSAVRRMLGAGIDLLLFSGGDGTARDVLGVVGDQVPVLGIPAGVKMHSAVFALTPRTAGQAARRFLEAGAPARLCAPAEVMDRELTADGDPASSPTLYGFMQTLALPSLVQSAKAAAGGSGDGAVMGALASLADEIRCFDAALLGPGATLLALKQALGFEGTLLGVDVFAGGRCIVKDAREDQIWDTLGNHPRTCLVVGVIGGQGFLFGRGNQQLSARVLGKIPRENIRVVAAADKLTALPASTLHVDTGDEAVDASLAGYLPVITGPRRSTMCRVASA